MMYLPYDTAQDFVMQFEKNEDTLCELLFEQFGIETKTHDVIIKIMEAEQK